MMINDVKPHISALMCKPEQVQAKGCSLTIIRCKLKDSAFIPKALMADTKTVSFENPPEALWYLAFLNKKFVGSVCSVVKDTKTGKTARFKSDVTDIQERGKGIYSALCNMRLMDAKMAGVKTVTCFSTKYSRHQFLKDGFEVVSEKADGVVYMKKKLAY